jgi:hypothetical protein
VGGVAAGYLTLRFSNDDVLFRLREVLARIRATAEKRSHEPDTGRRS